MRRHAFEHPLESAGKALGVEERQARPAPHEVLAILRATSAVAHEIDAVAADALSDEGKAAAGEGNAKLKILRSYEPPKKESGVKIQEESDEDSALAAVKMMTEAKVL